MNQLEHLIRFGDEDKAVKIITEEFVALVEENEKLTEKVKRIEALNDALLALLVKMEIDEAEDAIV